MFCGGDAHKFDGQSVVEIQTLNLQEYKQPDETSFDVSRFLNGLKTNSLGKEILYAPTISSTQTLLMQHLTAASPGTIFVADTQTSGKGRGSNQWTSPAGCLCVSIKMTMQSAKLLPFFQYVVALAIVQSLRAARQELKVSIKWPNDLYLSGRKVGGILCQSSAYKDRFDIVIGVGLNVSNSDPSVCLNDALKGAAPLTREEVLVGLLNRLEPAVATLEAEGFLPFLQDYLASWMHTDQEVVLKDCGRRAVVKGLASSGYLRAVDLEDPQKEYELHPDGTSLDWMSGLVQAKK